MSYYSDTKKVDKMFTCMTTGGSNSLKAGFLTLAVPKQKKLKKSKKDKKDKKEHHKGSNNKQKAKDISEAPLIELSDWESLLEDVPFAPTTVPFCGTASSSRYNWIIFIHFANWWYIMKIYADFKIE